MERLGIALIRLGLRIIPHREKAFLFVRRNKAGTALRIETRINLSPEVTKYALESWAGEDP